MSIFRKPSTKKLGLKVLTIGEKGVGKSVFALSFPEIYALDAEAGMAWYEGGEYGKNLLGITNTQDFNELQEAIEELMELERGTLVIDSETKFYDNLTDAVLGVEEAKARKAGRDVMDSAVSMRGWGRIKSVATRLQNLKIDLSAKGVNIVSISQIEDVKQKMGDNFVKVGEKPVMAKRAEYDYDIIIKLFTEKDANGNVHHKGEILKDRTSVTKVGQIIDNPSYEIWKGYVETRKDADVIKSNLTEDNTKVKKALIEEDIEAEKTTTDKLKELMQKSPEHQAKALEMIKSYKIANPLSPKDANEVSKINEIVEVLSAM